MKITTQQIIRIQSAMSSRFTDRDERLEFVSSFLGRVVKSTKELTTFEADDLIYFLNKGEVNQQNWWGTFDSKKEKYRQERKLLWSYLYQAQWTVPSVRHNAVPDTKRLSAFLKSNKSPVNKPLKEWNKKEWEKILHAFRQIVKFQHA